MERMDLGEVIARIQGRLDEVKHLEKKERHLELTRDVADAMLEERCRVHPYPDDAARPYTDAVMTRIEAAKRGRKGGELDEYQRARVGPAARVLDGWLFVVTRDLFGYMREISKLGDSPEPEDRRRVMQLKSALDDLLVGYERKSYPFLPKRWRSWDRGPGDPPNCDVLEYVRRWLGAV